MGDGMRWSNATATEIGAALRSAGVPTTKRGVTWDGIELRRSCPNGLSRVVYVRPSGIVGADVVDRAIAVVRILAAERGWSVTGTRDSLAVAPRPSGD